MDIGVSVRRVRRECTLDLHCSSLSFKLHVNISPVYRLGSWISGEMECSSLPYDCRSTVTYGNYYCAKREIIKTNSQYICTQQVYGNHRFLCVQFVDVSYSSMIIRHIVFLHTFKNSSIKIRFPFTFPFIAVTMSRSTAKSVFSTHGLSIGSSYEC